MVAFQDFGEKGLFAAYIKCSAENLTTPSGIRVGMNIAEAAKIIPLSKLQAARSNPEFMCYGASGRQKDIIFYVDKNNIIHTIILADTL